MHQPTPDTHHESSGDHTRKLDQTEVPGADTNTAHMAVKQRAIRFFKTLDLVIFLGISLNHAHGRNALLQCAEVLPDSLAHCEIRRV